MWERMFDLLLGLKRHRLSHGYNIDLCGDPLWYYCRCTVAMENWLQLVGYTIRIYVLLVLYSLSVFFFDKIFGRN